MKSLLKNLVPLVVEGLPRLRRPWQIALRLYYNSHHTDKDPSDPRIQGTLAIDVRHVNDWFAIAEVQASFNRPDIQRIEVAHLIHNRSKDFFIGGRNYVRPTDDEIRETLKTLFKTWREEHERRYDGHAKPAGFAIR